MNKTPIKGLFETHLFVKDLERSIEFYGKTLGLTPCEFVDERKIAFFWLSEDKQSFLGLWEKPQDEIDIRHFAFRCDLNFVLNESVDYLTQRNLKCWNFLNNGTNEPMVFAWVPAIAIYFDDPDGHSLEFIAKLEGSPKPELGIVSYPQWLELMKL